MGWVYVWLGNSFIEALTNWPKGGFLQNIQEQMKTEFRQDNTNILVRKYAKKHLSPFSLSLSFPPSPRHPLSLSPEEREGKRRKSKAREREVAAETNLDGILHNREKGFLLFKSQNTCFNVMTAQAETRKHIWISNKAFVNWKILKYLSLKWVTRHQTQACNRKCRKIKYKQKKKAVKFIRKWKSVSVKF